MSGPDRVVLGRSGDGPSSVTVDPSGPRGRPVTARGRFAAGSGRSGGDRDGAVQGEGVSPRRSGRRWRWARRSLVVVLVVCLVAPFGLLWWGKRSYDAIPKVDVASALSPRSGRHGTNYLIVGTDSRDGIGTGDPNASAFLGEDVSGTRTDTIMVLHVEGSSTTLTSIPRDLWITDPATGQKGRINSTFAAGPKNLLIAVEALGIPIDHYLQIGFVAFGRLIDAIGGITIVFDHQARDEHSGLYVYATGPVHLDGTGALAYVRSRYYSELIDGRWRVDGTADLGRTLRQRAFLTALLAKMTAIRNPITLASIPGAVGKGLVIDSTMSYLDALRLGWTLKDLHPEAVAIPVIGRRTSGGADVLDLAPDASSAISPLAR